MAVNKEHKTIKEMNAKDLFPDDNERKKVKEIIDLYCGTIIKIVDNDGKIVYQY